MTVRLMLTCLCDAFYGEVGIATVQVLEAAGCKVEFLEGQTCCGQPPFNAGDWAAARAISLRTTELFAGDVPVVTPSASCAAMVRNGYSKFMREEPFKCFELCEFLVEQGVLERLSLRSKPRRVALMESCHNRMLRPAGSSSPQMACLSAVAGIEIASTAEPEQCCGFGGAFSATHGSISSGIGSRKLECLMEARVDEVLGGDMGCLMHLKGLASRWEGGASVGERSAPRIRHIAELLAGALP